MLRAGTYSGKVLDVGEDESQAGPYIGLEIEIPELKEVPERRLYFTSPKAIENSRRILGALGVDPKQPPLPQLRKLIGRAVMVKTRIREFGGVENLEVVNLWTGAKKNNTSVASAINAALGIESDEAEDPDELIFDEEDA